MNDSEIEIFINNGYLNTDIVILKNLMMLLKKLRLNICMNHNNSDHNFQKESCLVLLMTVLKIFKNEENNFRFM